MTGEPLRITDPQRVRALAHPLRLELLDVLAEGPRTATECAAATGESVASCAFHLKMLAKYAYVEPAARRGREKPWQLTAPSRDIRPDDDDPSSVRAVGAMAEVYVEHEVDRIRAYVHDVAAQPMPWVQASTLYSSATWLTLDELAELSTTIQALTERFDGRMADPSLRPEGARPVHVFAAAHADVVRERRP